MASGGKGSGASLRERIVRRAALEFKDGMYGILICTCTCVTYNIIIIMINTCTSIYACTYTCIYACI